MTYIGIPDSEIQTGQPIIQNTFHGFFYNLDSIGKDDVDWNRYTTSGSKSVPANVTKCIFIAIGGGGGGASGSTASGGGGGGGSGCVRSEVIDVVGGTTISVTIGAGGTGGAVGGTGVAGNNGGGSSIGGLTAQGGGGGQPNNIAGDEGGFQGSGELNAKGGNAGLPGSRHPFIWAGGVGAGGTSALDGGGGAASGLAFTLGSTDVLNFLGSGGNGGVNANGANATGNGGGGGGGGSDGGGNSWAGGNGSAGVVFAKFV